MNKEVYIISAGMDGAATLTAEAARAVSGAEELIGSRRLLELFKGLGKPAFASFSSKDIADHIAGSEYGSFAVLMSGDCGFYSGARTLLPLLKGFDAKVLPGISTPVYLCAKLKMPWHDLYFVSLHGREGAIVRPVRAHEKTFFLLGGRTAPADVCQRLTEYGLGELTVHIGENLALAGERITTAKARELTECPTANLSVVKRP